MSTGENTTAIAPRTPRIGWLLVAGCALALNVHAQAAGGDHKAARGDEPVPLDTTTIKGQQGLPRVMSIVPWKRPGVGDLPGRPAVSLVNEALSPLDRGELRRQLRYEHDLQAATELPVTTNAAQDKE